MGSLQAIRQALEQELYRREFDEDALVIWSAVGLGSDPRLSGLLERAQEILDEKAGEVIPWHLEPRPDHEGAFSFANRRLEVLQRCGQESDVLTFDNVLALERILQAANNKRASEVIARRFPDCLLPDAVSAIEKEASEWARLHWNLLEESALVAPWRDHGAGWEPTIDAIRVDQKRLRLVPQGVSVASRTLEHGQNCYLAQFAQDHARMGWTVQEHIEAATLGTLGRVVVVKALSAVQ